MTQADRLVFLLISDEDVNLETSVATFPPNKQWMPSRNQQSLEMRREKSLAV